MKTGKTSKLMVLNVMCNGVKCDVQWFKCDVQSVMCLFAVEYNQYIIIVIVFILTQNPVAWYIHVTHFK